MPAVKCFPVEDSTMARTSPRASSSRAMAGSSVQNSRTIELYSSGRDMVTWATLAVTSTSKQRYPMDGEATPVDRAASPAASDSRLRCR